jgi:hypothetical protein
MSYQHDLEKTMTATTHQFHRDVIEATIDSLRPKFIARGLGEDVLDRLKASWTKTLISRIQSNKEEALKRHYERLETIQQTNKHYASVLQHRQIYESNYRRI